jgi:hypothetical protein
MIYVTTGFSVKMIKDEAVLDVQHLELDEMLKEIETIKSQEIDFKLGHEGTIPLIETLFNVDNLKVDRTPYSIKSGDILYLAMPNKRLEPGTEISADELETIATYYKVTVK